MPETAKSLTSLHVDHTRESGFAARVLLTHSKYPGPQVNAKLYFQLGSRNRVKPFNFFPFGAVTGYIIYFFLYIGEDGQLHLWDVKKEGDNERTHHTNRYGFSAEEVKERCPNLFKVAQEKGFWKD